MNRSELSVGQFAQSVSRSVGQSLSHSAPGRK
jgi:hypothetical protein